MKVDVERAALVLGTIERGESLRDLTLNPSVMAQLNKQLRRAGFLEPRGRGYRLTPSGKVALSAFLALAAELKKNGTGDKTMTGVRRPRAGAPRPRALTEG